MVKKPNVAGEEELVVVPQCCRSEVLRIMHCSPTAGHFGEVRTLDIFRKRVVWSRMSMDVKEVVSHVPNVNCSLTTLKRAPLQSLPVVRIPFDRVAMNIIGPLK